MGSVRRREQEELRMYNKEEFPFYKRSGRSEGSIAQQCSVVCLGSVDLFDFISLLI